MSSMHSAAVLLLRGLVMATAFCHGLPTYEQYSTRYITNVLVNTLQSWHLQYKQLQK
jgi:hypothetical protein